MRNQKGSAIVEAALIMPILCLMFAGILEFGRMLMVQQVLTNAAREGARIGAIQMDDTLALESAQTTAEEYLTRCGLTLDIAQITPVFAEVNGTDALQLEISYDYGHGLSGWVPTMGSSLALRSRAVMRREA